MKCYKFKVRVIKNGITIERKAELTVDDNFTMESIKHFEEDFKKALSEIRKAVIAQNYFTVEFTVSVYEHWLEDGKEPLQKDFDYWIFNGYSDDREGIYLAADERYTDATRDIYIEFRNPLEGIISR